MCGEAWGPENIIRSALSEGRVTRRFITNRARYFGVSHAAVVTTLWDMVRAGAVVYHPTDPVLGAVPTFRLA